MEEEGRLNDPALRENFIERVFVAARWRSFLKTRPRARDLVAFHIAHKFAVLAHSPAHYARLGRLVAAAGGTSTRAPLDEYQALLMEAHAVRATRGRHANVLTHMAGYFKRELGTDERAEFVEVIGEYRRGLVPLVVPLTLVKHHVRRLEVRYLAGQVYLNPASQGAHAPQSRLTVRHGAVPHQDRVVGVWVDCEGLPRVSIKVNSYGSSRDAAREARPSYLPCRRSCGRPSGRTVNLCGDVGGLPRRG